MMNTNKQKLLDLALKSQAIRFGDFTLKSGRKSPYFFNAGQFNTGQALATLGHAYAQLIQELQIPFDMLYGPAYKGIPLVSSTAIAFAEQFNQSIPYAFNRKQSKTYGDGGDFVGAPLQGRVILIDDVVTAGTTITETLELFKSHDVSLQAVIIMFDREEQMSPALQAIQETHAIPMHAVLKARDLIDWLGTQNAPESLQHQQAIMNYLKEYGRQS